MSLLIVLVALSCVDVGCRRWHRISGDRWGSLGPAGAGSRRRLSTPVRGEKLSVSVLMSLPHATSTFALNPSSRPVWPPRVTDVGAKMVGYGLVAPTQPSLSFSRDPRACAPRGSTSAERPPDLRGGAPPSLGLGCRVCSFAGTRAKGLFTSEKIHQTSAALPSGSVLGGQEC